jgi:hypothetical protein
VLLDMLSVRGRKWGYKVLLLADYTLKPTL